MTLSDPTDFQLLSFTMHKLMNGQLNGKQKEALQPYVEALDVYDLGAGIGHLSCEIAGLGAASVTAIDARSEPDISGWPDNVRYVRGLFAEPPVPPEDISIAFISWPNQYKSRGLLYLLENAAKVIYLGCNHGGTACGSTKLWSHLTGRKVLDHVPDKYNTLIVYGNELDKGETRELLPEEAAATDRSNVYFWEDLYVES